MRKSLNYTFIKIIILIVLNCKLINSQNINSTTLTTITTTTTVTTLNCLYGTISDGNSCIECGITDVSPNVKIVGGVQALPYSWPAQVLVIINYKTDYYFPYYGSRTISQQFECGGTLITQRAVLTAGHCVIDSFLYSFNGATYTIPITTNSYYPTKASMFTIYAGVFDITSAINSGSVSSPGVKRSVSNVLRHPSYNPNNDLNDIALLTLSQPVQIGTNIKLACLPKEYSTTYPSSGQYSYASGWGTLYEGGAVTQTLYNVRLNVYDQSSCSGVLPSYTKNWNAQICSGESSGGKDTCQGDSGGGLYVYDTTLNKYILAGITSYGDGCAKVGLPGLYTRVSYYLDWIRSNLQTNSSVSGSNSDSSIGSSGSSNSGSQSQNKSHITKVSKFTIVIYLIILSAFLIYFKF